MRQFIISLLILTAISAYGQDKHNYVHYNKLTAVEGTAYVIASYENRGKIAGILEKHLLFINTENGETNQIDFPKDASIKEIKQIKLDSLHINLILISAKTVDLNDKKGIDWDDPMQLIVLSVDGKEKSQLTEDHYFVQNWIVNNTTGRIIITGYYDSNNNRRLDKSDKNELLMYDLKTLKRINIPF